jgi:hypothetical protein
MENMGDSEMNSILVILTVILAGVGMFCLTFVLRSRAYCRSYGDNLSVTKLGKQLDLYSGSTGIALVAIFTTMLGLKMPMSDLILYLLTAAMAACVILNTIGVSLVEKNNNQQ